jgi:hypothetical protein
VRVEAVLFARVGARHTRPFKQLVAFLAHSEGARHPLPMSGIRGEGRSENRPALPRTI